MTTMKRAIDYGVKDPIFDHMWLQRLGGAAHGTWIIRCECAKWQQPQGKASISWKKIKGTWAKVQSLGAAQKWARRHLEGADHRRELG